MIPELSLTEWLLVAPALIGIFSVIAKHTKTEVDDKIVQTLVDIVQFLGQNKGAVEVLENFKRPKAAETETKRGDSP